jgi:hypothetical protein
VALEQIPSAGASDDESFRASVRAQFELTPEFTNLVSVVRGNFTKTNREIVFNETTRVNQLLASTQSRIFVVDCEHEQKTNTSGKVHQMRSAGLQRRANQSTQRQDYEREDMYGSNWKHAG